MSDRTTPTADLIAARAAIDSVCTIVPWRLGHRNREALAHVVAQALADTRRSTLEGVATEARRYAGYYPQSSDGRNTFILFAEWCERRQTEETP